jgi:hypothetical protein
LTVTHSANVGALVVKNASKDAAMFRTVEALPRLIEHSQKARSMVLATLRRARSLRSAEAHFGSSRNAACSLRL